MIVYTYQEKADAASKCQILCIVPDLSICEKEGHGDESTDDHGPSSTPEEFASTHEASQDWRRDGACIGDGIVAPVDILRLLAKLCTASGQVGG